MTACLRLSPYRPVCRLSRYRLLSVITVTQCMIPVITKNGRPVRGAAIFSLQIRGIGGHNTIRGIGGHNTDYCFLGQPGAPLFRSRPVGRAIVATNSSSPAGLPLCGLKGSSAQKARRHLHPRLHQRSRQKPKRKTDLQHKDPSVFSTPCLGQGDTDQ